MRARYYCWVAVFTVKGRENSFAPFVYAAAFQPAPAVEEQVANVLAGKPPRQIELARGDKNDGLQAVSLETFLDAGWVVVEVKTLPTEGFGGAKSHMLFTLEWGF